MLKFDAFNLRDKQHLLQMLKMAIDTNVTDTVELYNELKNQMPDTTESKAHAYNSAKQCPKCGSKNYHRGRDKFGGVTTEFMWCKSCTYSKEII